MNIRDQAEGGPRAWLMWGLGAVFFAYGFFHRMAPGVMVSDLMRDFAVGAALAGNLAAFYFYAYVAVQIPVGMLAERFGPRAVLAAGAVLCGFGSVLFGSADTLATASVGRFIVGAGVGVAFVSTLKLAAIWLPARRFALASGLTVMCGMLGGIGGQAPLAAATAAFGWRGAMIGAGVAAFVLGVTIWLVVRDRPAGISLRPEKESPPEALFAGLGDVLAKPQTWIIAAVGLAMSAPLLAFAGLWAVPYMMESYGLARPAAAGAVSIVLIGWAVGAPVQGWLSDRLGRWRAPLIGVNALGLGTFAVLIYVPELSLGVAEALLFANGFFCGGLPLVYAAVREANPRAIGPAIAFVNMVIVASGALLQPLIGWLLDLAWDGRMAEGTRVYSAESFRWAFLSLVASGGLGLALSVATRERKTVE